MVRHTAGGTDVRYQTFTGSNQEYLEHDHLPCLAQGALDRRAVARQRAGVERHRAGSLCRLSHGRHDHRGHERQRHRDRRHWTSSSTLTGCAYTHLKFKLTGQLEQAREPVRVRRHLAHDVPRQGRASLRSPPRQHGRRRLRLAPGQRSDDLGVGRQCFPQSRASGAVLRARMEDQRQARRRQRRSSCAPRSRFLCGRRERLRRKRGAQRRRDRAALSVATA
jgi:hypothetical protein